MPSRVRKCNVCGANNHFTRSPLCSGNSSSSNRCKTTTRRVEDRNNTNNSSDTEKEKVDTVQDGAWPGYRVRQQSHSTSII